MHKILLLAGAKLRDSNCDKKKKELFVEGVDKKSYRLWMVVVWPCEELKSEARARRS